MLYKDFEVGGRTYKLAMNTRSIIDLEKKLGCNPLSIFGNGGDRIPTITDMINILSASFGKFEHGLNQNDAMNIFDSWLAEGHNVAEFVPIIIDIYKASGIIGNDAAEDNGDAERKN